MERRAVGRLDDVNMKTKQQAYARVVKGQPIDIDKVMSVYSGVDGRCCCGCSGKHTTASKYREMRGKILGRPVKDDEINDRTVTMIVNRINKAIAAGAESLEYGTSYVSIINGKRNWIAYLLKK